MLLIVGDINPKIGEENKDRERVMGRHVCGIINNNGERLCDFCQENNLVVGGTLFQHKNIHKTTWTSSDGPTKNQIDHILINAKWRRSLQDVRVYRGADIASYHNLLVVNITIKLHKTGRGQERGRQLDLSKLTNNMTKQAFKPELKDRFRVLGEEQEIDTDIFNQALREAGEKVLGSKKKKKEEWIQTEMWQKITEKKEMKQKINSARSERVKNQLKVRYSELDKKVKMLAKKDKRE